MKVLLLTQVLPYPPDAGPKIKTFNLLRHLATRHEVSLLSFVRSAAEADLARHLQPYCRQIQTVPLHRSAASDLRHLAHSLLSGQPFVVARDQSPAMQAALWRLTREETFDIVHADQLNMAQFALPLAGPRRVLDQHNAVWTVVQRLWAQEPVGPRRLVLRWEWQKLRRYEGDICPAFDAVVTVSREDRRALESVLAGPVPMYVIPIGIDTREVQPVKRNADASAIITIGTLFWPPNVDGIVWFAREVWPKIKRQRPDARFLVVGSRPAPSLVRLGKEDPAIQVTGYVADTAPLIRDSALLIVPLRAGGGMRVKILNAMAQGLPIVSTTLGYEGIEAVPGRDLLVGDTPGELAAAVLSVLADLELGRRLGAQGRRLVEERYDWRTVCPAIDRVYADVMRPA